MASDPPPALEVLDFPESGPDLPPGAIARLGRHRLQVDGRPDLPSATTPDGVWIWTCRAPHLWLFDARSGVLRRRLTPTPGAASLASVPGTGRLLYVSSEPYGLFEWLYPRDEVRKVADLPGRTARVVGTPDGSTLAGVVGERDVVVIDTRSGEVRVLAPRQDRIATVRISDDGRRVASVAHGQERISQFDYADPHTEATVWEAPGWEVAWTRREDGTRDALEGDPPVPALAPPRPTLAARRRKRSRVLVHTDPYGKGFAVAPDGRWVTSGSWLFDLDGGRPRRLSPGAREGLLGFSAGSARLLSRTRSGRIACREVPGLARLPAFVDLAGKTSQAAVAPDGSWIAFAQKERKCPRGGISKAPLRIHLRRLPGFEHLGGFEFPGRLVRYLVPTPDSSALLVEGAARSSRITHRKKGATYQRALVVHHLRAGTTVAYEGTFPDHLSVVTPAVGGELFALLGYDRDRPHRVELRTFPAGEVVTTFEPERGQDALTFSPDGRLLASVFRGRRVDLFDLRTHHFLEPLEDPMAAPRGLAFLRGGDALLAYGGDGTALLWDLTRREAPGRGRGGASRPRPRGSG